MPHTTISGEYDLGYDSDLEPVKEHLKRHPDDSRIYRSVPAGTWA
jgi:hypothetical protein